MLFFLWEAKFFLSKCNTLYEKGHVVLMVKYLLSSSKVAEQPPLSLAESGTCPCDGLLPSEFKSRSLSLGGKRDLPSKAPEEGRLSGPALLRTQCACVLLPQSFKSHCLSKKLGTPVGVPKFLRKEGFALATAFCMAVCGPPRCKRNPAGAFDYRSVQVPIDAKMKKPGISARLFSFAERGT